MRSASPADARPGGGPAVPGARDDHGLGRHPGDLDGRRDRHCPTTRTGPTNRGTRATTGGRTGRGWTGRGPSSGTTCRRCRAGCSPGSGTWSPSGRRCRTWRRRWPRRSPLLSDPGVLPVLRRHPLGPLLELFNVTDGWRPFPGWRLAELGLTGARDALCGNHIIPGPDGNVWLHPYGVLWLVRRLIAGARPTAGQGQPILAMTVMVPGSTSVKPASRTASRPRVPPRRDPASATSADSSAHCRPVDPLGDHRAAGRRASRPAVPPVVRRPAAPPRSSRRARPAPSPCRPSSVMPAGTQSRSASRHRSRSGGRSAAGRLVRRHVGAADLQPADPRVQLG